jgi:hypothetical protein
MWAYAFYFTVIFWLNLFLKGCVFGSTFS